MPVQNSGSNSETEGGLSVFVEREPKKELTNKNQKYTINRLVREPTGFSNKSNTILEELCGLYLHCYRLYLPL
ncbi:hypothetical protein AGMMS50255_4460 [Spirochaetia bacterium]|nr:hypothetical protein AGMMS50255_4460 [Spirochaetia bacterium]